MAKDQLHNTVGASITRQVERSRDVPKKMYIDPQAAFAPKECFDLH